MNDPQLWGAIRGVLIALGGAVAGFGLMSAAQWAEIVNQTVAIGLAVAGLATIVVPMVRGWQSRSDKATLVTAGEVPGVAKVVMNSDATAATVPSNKVVGPSGA